MQKSLFICVLTEGTQFVDKIQRTNDNAINSLNFGFILTNDKVQVSIIVNIEITVYAKICKSILADIFAPTSAIQRISRMKNVIVMQKSHFITFFINMVILYNKVIYFVAILLLIPPFKTTFSRSSCSS